MRPLALAAIVGVLAAATAAVPTAAAAPDVALERGLDFVHETSFGGPGKRQFAFYDATAGGVCWGDYDRDGHPDALFTNFLGPKGTGRVQLYRNLGPAGDYGFEDVTDAAGLHVVGIGQGCAWGDYDNDGWRDLYLSFVVTPYSHQGNALLRNVNGTFQDVTEAAGVSGASTGSGSPPCNPSLQVTGGRLERCWSTGAAWLDYDLDGDLDLYVAHYAQFPFGSCQREFDANPIFCLGQANRLYRNDGGVFTDVARAAGVEANSDPSFGRSLGVMAVDVNDDGWSDLYVANDMDAGALYVNNQDGTFTDRATQWGLDNRGAKADGGMGHRAGMGVEVDDANGDGRVDFLSTHLHGEHDALYLSQSDGSWLDAGGQLGEPPSSSRWGGAFLDVDLDGDKDYLVVTGGQAPNDAGPLLLWHQEDGQWHAQGKAEGWPWGEGRHGNYRGLAIADADDDGSPDALVGTLHSWEETPRHPRLLDFSGAGNWLRVALQGTDGNRDAVGAKVEVQAGNRSWVEHRHGGGHYLGSNEERLLFGLGNATEGTLEVTWPGGATSTAQWTANTTLHVIQPNLQPPAPVAWVQVSQNPPMLTWARSTASDFDSYRIEWDEGSREVAQREITDASIPEGATGVSVKVIDTAGHASTPRSPGLGANDTVVPGPGVMALIAACGVAILASKRRTGPDHP